LSLPGLRPAGRVCVLLAGVSVALVRLQGANDSTATPAHKGAASSAPHSSAVSTGRDPVKRVGTSRPSAVSGVHRPAGNAAPAGNHPKAGSGPARTQASRPASVHSAAAARISSSRPASRRHSRRRRTLTRKQRLARLHLQPGRVEEIQQALIREGYLKGEPSGQWGAATRGAMLRFQTEHGFPATGLPEAKSLMKLGLGSHPLPPELDHNLARAAAPGAPSEDASAPSAPDPTPIHQ